VPAPCFDLYWTYGYPDLLAWFREILETIQPDPMFRTDAPSFVEISLRRKKDALLVHFVNGNPGRDLSWYNSSDLWADDVPPLGAITCHIRCPAKPRAVTVEPGAIPAQTEWKAGVLKAVLPRLEIHACLAVQGFAASATWMAIDVEADDALRGSPPHLVRTLLGVPHRTEGTCTNKT
jgi:hypothetical protein